MKKSFFEDKFDYSTYIKERLMEVDDLEKRRELNDVMTNVLIPFYEDINSSYNRLEQKIGSPEKKHNYEIITGLSHRNRIDGDNDRLTPMIKGDINSRCISVKEMMEKVDKGMPLFVYSIVVNADYRMIQQMAKENRQYSGFIVTDKGQYQIKCIIQKTKRYLDLIEQLYKVFTSNHIEWKTVFAPYLYKMFDVYIISAQNPQGGKIEQVYLDFEEYAELIEYDCVPIWNVRDIKSRTSIFPEACKDGIHYLHTIYGSNIDCDKDYLVCDDVDLWNISKTEDKLQIRCKKNEPTSWRLKEISYNPKIMDEEFEMFSNSMTSVIKPIRTKAYLKYIVNSMNIGNEMILDDVRVVDDVDEIYTYSMNSFITDEIRNWNHEHYLILELKKGQVDKKFIIDYMSYISSNISFIYPEFKCIGVLKE